MMNTIGDGTQQGDRDVGVDEVKEKKVAGSVHQKVVAVVNSQLRYRRG
jgi:hypothetical protein